MILRDVSRGNIPCRSGIGEKNTDLSDADLIAREADLRAVLPFDETVLVRGHETRHLVEEILLLNFHFSFCLLAFYFLFLLIIIQGRLFRKWNRENSFNNPSQLKLFKLRV